MESIRLEQDKTVLWRQLFTALILASFVFRVFILVNPLNEPSYQLLFSLMYMSAAVYALQCPALREQKGFHLILPCFFWALISCAFHPYQEREVMFLASYVLMMVFAFFVCYPQAFLWKQTGQRLLNVVAAGYLALICGLSLVGIYVAITGVSVPSLAGSGFVAASFTSQRLSLFCYPTISSTFCCLAMLMGLYLVLECRRPLARALCILAMLPPFAALALTDSRTSCFFFSACFGGFCFLVAKGKLTRPKPVAATALALLIAAAGVGCAFGGLQLTYKGINAISPDVQTVAQQPVSEPVPAEHQLPAAIDIAPARLVAHNSMIAPIVQPIASQPEEAQQTDDSSGEPRSLFENFSTFQGRTYAWEGALNALKHQPKLLLVGSSPLFVMEAVDPYIEQLYGGESFVHLHSIFFQTLVAFGLPGLLLFGALMLYILFHGLRLFFCGGKACTLAQRTLPLLLFFCIAVDTLEIFLSFADVMKHTNPWFFLVAGYVVYLSTTRIPNKKQGVLPNPQPEP